MFADLDETIRQLLIRRVPLDLAEVDVSFEAPDREWSGRLSRPTVNCFLYAIQENLDLRKSGWETRRDQTTATVRSVPIYIDASYQVTTWARAPEDEHRLLWRVLAALGQQSTLPEDLLQGEMKTQPFPVLTRLARPDQKPHISPADLWQALDNRIRPALNYAVTLYLDLAVEFTSPLTFTRTLRMTDLNGHVSSEAQAIGGRVRGRDDPTQVFSDVTVLMRETGVEVNTDDEGRFAFHGVPRGRITLVARVPGRPEIVRPVDVPSPSYDVEV